MPATVAVVRCRSYERAEVEDALARAVALAGGLPAVKPGGTVLLKPNFLYGAKRERIVNTDPEVARAAATLFRGRDVRLALGDSPAVESAKRVFRVCGMAEAFEGIDLETVEFSDGVAAQAARIRGLRIAKEALEADAVINLARLKTHGMMGMTMAVKNLFGCLSGLDKGRAHLRAGEDRKGFAGIVAGVAHAVNAPLHVLDAVVAMEGNGPGSGTPRPLGVLLASTDPVALDRVACDLVGFPAKEHLVLDAARALAWGETDLGKIERVGDPLEEFAVRDFKPARRASQLSFLPLPRFAVRLLRRFLAPPPRLDASRCRACGRCALACPASALSISGRTLCLDRNACIRCHVCQEICPEGALSAGR